MLLEHQKFGDHYASQKHHRRWLLLNTRCWISNCSDRLTIGIVGAVGLVGATVGFDAVDGFETIAVDVLKMHIIVIVP